MRCQPGGGVAVAIGASSTFARGGLRRTSCAPGRWVVRPLERAMSNYHAIWTIALLTFTGCTCDSRGPVTITRIFPTSGVANLVVRAATVESATVTTNSSSGKIEISGLPTGGARGYHPPNANWRETPPQRWGLDFVGKRYGEVLVVSTANEIHCIHHRYVLGDLHISVPARVGVLLQQRCLDGSGAPNLSPP